MQDASSGSVVDGPDPATYRYSCTGAPGFLLTLLVEPATAELKAHPSATGLRDFLDDDAFGLDFLPESAWWLVSRSDTEAQYIARLIGRDESPFGYVTMRWAGAGWGLDGGGDCLPGIMIDGQVGVTWTLDPGRPFPEAPTMEFTALVTDRGCTGGEPVSRRSALTKDLALTSGKRASRARTARSSSYQQSHVWYGRDQAWTGAGCRVTSSQASVCQRSRFDGAPPASGSLLRRHRV